MNITKHLDREINLIGDEARALREEGYNEEADTLYAVCDRLRAVSIRIETQACEERTKEIFVVMGLSVDGDRAVTYGAYASMDAAQVKRQFVMSDFGKEVWVERTLLQHNTES